MLLGGYAVFIVIGLIVSLFLYRPNNVAPFESLVQQSWFQLGTSVPFLTFLFDLIDLRPRVGSFSFVASKTYGVYLVFRSILGYLAAAVLGAANLLSNPFLLSLVSVITSVTVLQNFALSVAGKKTANLSELFDTFKDMMENEEAKRVAQEKDAQMAELAAELSKLPLESLESNASLLFLRNPTQENPQAEVSKLTEPDARGIYLATYLVKQNPEFCKSVIEEERLKSRRSSLSKSGKSA